MAMRTGAIRFTAIVALSLVSFPKRVFSVAPAVNDQAIEFAAHRLDRGAVIEARDLRGNIIACGKLSGVKTTATLLQITAVHDNENLRDCPRETTQPQSLPLNTIGSLDVITPNSEFYLFNGKAWIHTQWQRPIRRDSNPFTDAILTRDLWRRYTRPPKGIPGVYWPEIRVAAGGYYLTKVNDFGAAGALALDFKLHKLLYPLTAFIETTFASRIQNANPDLISPNALLVFQIGIMYSVINGRIFSLALSANGGVIAYRVDENADGLYGIRPVMTIGLPLFWHWRKNGVDFHKFSFFAEPRSTVIMHREAKNLSAWPLLFEIRLGVRYAY